MRLISYEVMTFHLPNHGGNNTDYGAQGYRTIEESHSGSK